MKRVDLDMLATDIADVLNGEDYEVLSAHGVPASAVRAVLDDFLDAISAAQAPRRGGADTLPTLPPPVEPEYVRTADGSTYMLTRQTDADWADEVHAVHLHGRCIGTIERTADQWRARRGLGGTHGPRISRVGALILLAGLDEEANR